MKKFFLMCVILAGCMDGVWSQISVFDCQALDPTVTQQEIDATNDYYKQCIHFDAPGGYQFGLVDNNNVHAVSEISLKDGFHSGHFVGPGQMHLYLDEKKSLDVFLMNQEFDLSGVPLFGKLELGLNLDPSISTHISDFFAGSNTGTELNPFDPQDVDIEATFQWFNPNTGQWFVALPRFGFYYEEFNRNIGTESWIPVDAGKKFRIRFTPRIQGRWRGVVKVKVNGVVVQESNEFTFQVVPSNEKDFVRVGQNKRYFVCGNEPFFPVGQNLAWPEPDTGMDGSAYAVPSNYLRYQQEMTDLADQGANYFRLLLNPISLEIEHKELGNYKNNMTKAWELDRIVEKAKEKDLRIHFNLQVHYPFETVNPYAFRHWDWSDVGSGNYGLCGLGNDDGNKYKTELGLDKPSEFLTDPEAKRIYKNRLRYIVSRWGYSTEIAVIELFSEMNNIGKFTNFTFVPDTTGATGGGCYSNGNVEWEYVDDPSVPHKVYEWQVEMLSYIKNELKHIDHPLSVNYTGGVRYFVDPNDTSKTYGADWALGDTTYKSKWLDIRTYNNYQYTPERLKGEYYAIRNINAYGQKPFMFSETGSGLTALGCDFNYEWKMAVLGSPFTGAAGAIPWDWGTFVSSPNSQNPNFALRNYLWHFQGYMADFMEGIPLDAEDWRPDFDERHDKKADMTYLRQTVTSGRKKAVGIIQNRTVNYYTAGNCLPSYANTEDVYNQAEQVSQADIFSPNNRLKVENMGVVKHYRVDFFNPITGQVYSSVDKWSNGFGNLFIEFGHLGSTTANSIRLFQVRPHNEPFKSYIPSEDYSYVLTELMRSEDVELDGMGESNVLIGAIENPASLGIDDNLYVVPNPSDGMCLIFFNELDQTDWELEVLNSVGIPVLHKLFFHSEKINLESQPKGVYFVKLYSNGKVLITKMVIQ